MEAIIEMDGVNIYFSKQGKILSKKEANSEENRDYFPKNNLVLLGVVETLKSLNGNEKKVIIDDMGNVELFIDGVLVGNAKL